MEGTKPKGASAHAGANTTLAREAVRFVVRDGCEYGVYADDSTFVSLRALSRLCGVTDAAVRYQLDGALRAQAAESENAVIYADSGPKRVRCAGELLSRYGHMQGTPLTDSVRAGGQTLRALREPTFMSQLAWFGVHSPRPTREAALALETFARAGARLYIHGLTGYTAAPRPLTASEQTLHIIKMRREETPPAPIGYYHVFGELTETVIKLGDAGAPYDDHSVTDVSAGQWYRRWWDERGLEAIYGRPIYCKFRYPAGWPQAKAGWIKVLAYPMASLGEFRLFLQSRYFQGPFQTYLKTKQSKGAITEADTARLLAAVSRAYPPRLEAGHV